MKYLCNLIKKMKNLLVFTLVLLNSGIVPFNKYLPMFFTKSGLLSPYQIFVCPIPLAPRGTLIILSSFESNLESEVFVNIQYPIDCFSQYLSNFLSGS